MKLYEINLEIARFLEANTDPETGELQNAEGLDALMVERGEKLESIALYIKNLDAFSEGLKAEEEKLKARRKRKEARRDSLKRFLESQLNGEKMETPRVNVSFRRSKALEVENPLLCKTWLENQGYDDCIRYKDPEIDKNALTRLIKTGSVEVPGVELVERLKMTVN